MTNQNNLVKTHGLTVRIREKCFEAGLTTAYQLQVASGISPSVAQNLFSGNFSEISLQTLEKLLEALNCTAADIFVKEKSQLQTAKEILQSAKRILVLTGAGVSAESNVPTFRGGGGAAVLRDAYFQEFSGGLSFEELSSVETLENNLPLLWQWFDYRRKIVAECEPNAAHRAIADWQRVGDFEEFTLVTQNVDGLHRRAGSSKVLELHGNIWRARCQMCSETFDTRDMPDEERLPVCQMCGDFLRPNVVLFGENLPGKVFETAVKCAQNCDVCLVVGTSSLVYPAASLPDIARQAGAKIIEINPEPTNLSDSADVSIRGKAGEILPQLSLSVIGDLNDSEKYVSQAEAAKLRGVSRQRIGQLVKSGRLKTVGEGHDSLINVDDLMNLTEGKKGQPRKTTENEREKPTEEIKETSTIADQMQMDGYVTITFPQSNAMTSDSHPLRVDFVCSEDFPELNKLGMTFAPGKKQRDAMSGNWQRDLSADIGRLRDYYKVDTLVSLIEEHELDALGISSLEQECQTQNIEIIRFPIADYSLPPDEDEYMLLIGKIIDRLYQNKNVVIHCKGGLGRAGMTAACAIVAATDDEISGEEAIEIVRAARKGTVETGKQEEFVRSFGDLLGKFENSDVDEYVDEEFSSVEEAINYYAELTAKEPDNAETFYNLGVAFDQNDQLDEAIAAYEKAIELNPNYAEAHYNLGQDYLSTNQLRKAESSLSAACRIAVEFAPAHFMLGVVFAAQGKFREAVAATERGLEFAPEDAMAHFNIGKSFYALGEFENAAESLEKTCEYAPDFSDAFYLLGKCYREFGEKEDEFNAYLEAVEIAPDFADAMFALGTVYAHLTETPEGRRVDYFETGGEVNLDDARIFFYMGLAQLALGNVETVIERQPKLREINEDLAGQLNFFINYFNEHKSMHISVGNEWMEEPEELNLDPEKLKKFRGCLLGGAVGDALGAAIEFDSLERIRQKFGAEGLTDYAPAYGRTGAITDDTQMTLFTAEGLLRGKTRHMHKGMYSAIRVIYFAYMRWLETQGIKLNDDELK